MAIQGKLTKSYKKQDLLEQKNQYTGFNRLTFAHKAAQGETEINLAALVVPTEMSALGFTNPSAGLIQSARLHFFKNNLLVISSLRGVLMNDLSYVIRQNKIVFVGFTAEANEIFTGVFEQSKFGTIPFVDAKPLVATGNLLAGSTDFAVGEGFELNKNPLSQLGAVVVYRNGLQQFRCEGNSLLGEGNYIEVGAGGTANIIRFKNTSGTEDSVSVVSVGSLAERPQESTTQFLENLSGKVDSMVSTLAEVAGVPESNFLGITNLDLKSFGDKVILLQSLVAALGVTTDAYAVKDQSNGTQYDLTVTGVSITSVVRAVGIPYKTKNGVWRLKFNIVAVTTASGSDVFTVANVLFKNVSNYKQGVAATCSGDARNFAAGYASPNTSNLVVISNNVTVLGTTSLSGDVELEAKPSFVV